MKETQCCEIIDSICSLSASFYPKVSMARSESSVPFVVNSPKTLFELANWPIVYIVHIPMTDMLNPTTHKATKSLKY